jgi:pimeloyl-ACP methyl ester carboxylesterase
VSELSRRELLAAGIAAGAGIALAAAAPGCAAVERASPRAVRRVAGVRTQARRVQVGPASIEYFVTGSGPPHAQLTALGAEARSFDPLVPRFDAAGYRIVAIHPRGAGRSTGPLAGITLHDLAGDAAGALVSACDAPAHVIGQGIGSRVARCLAADNPRLVRSLVAIGAVEPPSSAPGDPTAAAWAQAAAATPSGGCEGARGLPTLALPGRDPIAEQPEAVADAVLAFVRGLPRA